MECRKALREGAELAQLCGAGVFLLAIVNTSTGMAMAGGVNSAEVIQAEQDEAEAFLKDGVERLRARGLTAEGAIGFGDPVDEIANRAAEISADLIVVGNRHRAGLDRWWVKSVGKSLVKRAPCSVLVANPPENGGENA